MRVERVVFKSGKIPFFGKEKAKEVVRRLETLPESFFEFVKSNDEEMEVFLGKNPFTLKYIKGPLKKYKEIEPGFYQKSSREYFFRHKEEYFKLRIERRIF